MNRLSPYVVACLLLWHGGPAGAEALSQEQLNYGYAALYNAAKGLRHSDKIFLVKFESDAVEGVVQDLSLSMARITADLEALAQADPRAAPA